MARVSIEQLRNGSHRHEDYSWWEYDAQGIELAKVCEQCVDAALSVYRKVILNGYNQSDVNEPIEEES